MMWWDMLMGCLQPVNERTQVVDCLGMDQHDEESLLVENSARTSYDADAGAEVYRCYWETWTGSSRPDLLGETRIRFFFDGGEYRAIAFERSIETEEDGLEIGTYTATVGIWDGNIPAKDTFEISGKYSVCDILKRKGQCPDMPEDVLTKRYTVTTPAEPTTGAEGGLSQCYLVWDKAARAVTLQLEQGTFGKYNVGRLATHCGVGEAVIDTPRLQFDLYPVDDFGKSGPVAVGQCPGKNVPSLYYERELLLVGTPPDGPICHLANGQAPSTVQTTEDSECSIDFDGSGHVVVECSNVLDQAPPNFWYLNGDFRFEADCNLIER